MRFLSEVLRWWVGLMAIALAWFAGWLRSLLTRSASPEIPACLTHTSRFGTLFAAGMLLLGGVLLAAIVLIAWVDPAAMLAMSAMLIAVLLPIMLLGFAIDLAWAAVKKSHPSAGSR